MLSEPCSPGEVDSALLARWVGVFAHDGGHSLDRWSAATPAAPHSTLLPPSHSAESPSRRRARASLSAPPPPPPTPPPPQPPPPRQPRRRRRRRRRRRPRRPRRPNPKRSRGGALCSPTSRRGGSTELWRVLCHPGSPKRFRPGALRLVSFVPKSTEKRRARRGHAAEAMPCTRSPARLSER